MAVDDLRTPGDEEYAPLHVRLDNRLLQVWWRNRRIVPGFRCPWFAPQPSWRWAIGARDVFNPSPSPNPNPNLTQALIWPESKPDPEQVRAPASVPTITGSPTSRCSRRTTPSMWAPSPSTCRSTTR